MRVEPGPGSAANRDDLYAAVAAEYGRALGRLAQAYEADPDRRQDLLQEIHLEVWKSLELYRGECSIRTWVYRVAHNTAARYVARRLRSKREVLLSLEEIETTGVTQNSARAVDKELMEQVMNLIHHLRPPDRQLMLLYLEGLDTESIGEIIGLSPGNVRTKIHRLKALLARKFQGDATA